ncbi:MAG: DinB family protein [Acidobacteria bacterium]|nr:DinB family protein [Acidobacteriota bacterium]
MPDIYRITALLNRSQAGLYAAAQAIPEDSWRKPPSPGAWSAAEVFAHLTMVEEAITAGMARIIAAPPKGLPLWKRVHFPARLAQIRQLKRKTPIPLDPALVLDKAESLSRHTALRKRALDLLSENAGRDLGAYRHKHPFFGYLNFYDWFCTIGYHELRHSEQLQEIVEVFQK